MEWVKERDLLIEQTLAFVQSVNAKKADIKRADIMRSDTKPDLKLRIETAPIDATKIIESPTSVPASRAIVSGDFRAAMQARSAKVPSHQERSNRQHEEYFRATL